MGDDIIKVPQTSRHIYDDNQKPDTEKLKKEASINGGKGIVETYHPFDDENKKGVTTKYSNGNKVSIWENEDINGIPRKSTAIKIGDKEYYDWESDGKVDCVDTTTYVEEKRKNTPLEQIILGHNIRFK